MSDCAKIMIPFVEALGATGGETENEACLLDTMQFIGGVASAALQDPATRFDPIDRLIIAPAGFELSSIRDNGSRRDLDLLVLDTRPEKIAEVETLAGSCIGDELKISVFGLHQATELGRMKAHPFGKRAYWSAVSDRYVSPSPDLGQPPKLEKSIFPFAANLPPECLETWNLQLGKPGEEFVIPVAHPGSALLNYATRSLAGLRGKDAVKVRKMADNLLAKDPEMKDWLLGGPGQSQIALAGIFWALGSRRQPATPLNINGILTINPPELSSLAQRQEFMLKDAPAKIQDRVLNHARRKGRLLGAYERNPRLVKLWERLGLESKVNSIVKNR